MILMVIRFQQKRVNCHPVKAWHLQITDKAIQLLSSILRMNMLLSVKTAGDVVAALMEVYV